jgi:CRP/FNR family transcriptional regulator
MVMTPKGVITDSTMTSAGPSCLDLDQAVAHSEPMNKASILANCQLFHGVSQPHQKKLMNMARSKTFSSGTLIFRQNEACPGIYCVGSGLVRIYRIGAIGKEHTLHMAGSGQTFAEVAAIGGFPCPAYAEATETTTCVLLPTVDLMRMLREDHAFCMELLVGMSHWVRHLTGLLEDITLRDASGRVARHLLQAQPDIRGTIGLGGLKKHIASQLNLTSETFSRVLRKLSDEKMIQLTDSKRVRILEPQKLTALCE